MPQIEKFRSSIVMLMYETQEELTRAFCRVQEHYESPEYAGKVFTLGEYREWYARKNGSWTYFTDWDGFNVPTSAFELFIKGTFDPLTKEESELVEIVRYLGPGMYVIASYQGAPDDIREHELAHALYATDVPYRANVERYFKEHEQMMADDNPRAQYDALDGLIAKMRELGYNDKVIRDECHAYMAASQKWLREENITFPSELASYLRSNLLRSLEDA